MSSIAIARAAAAAAANAQVATAQVFALASNSALPATVAAPGKLAIEAKKFTLRAEGNCVVAVGTTTFKPTLLVGLTIPASPLVLGSWTTLAAGAAVAVGTTNLSGPWWIQADLIFDSLSGYLQGVWSQLVNNGWTAPAAIPASIPAAGGGINGSNNSVTQNSVVIPPADPVLQFAIAGTFSAAGVNIGNLANFEISF